MPIPKDPIILVSYLNTQLRDFYSSLTDLCKSLNLEETEIKQQMAAIDYHYDSEKNQFI